VSTRKIIIDTDPGIDDAMAIHFAFAHSDIEVVGLTTVFGNVAVNTATRNALSLVEMSGKSSVVSEGAKAPLFKEPAPPADFVHGKEGFGDVPITTPRAQPEPRSAAAFICDTINQYPGEVTVCAIAPLTNLAMALRHDPGIVERVRSIAIMGGAVDTAGNVTAWAEANIWSDPHAADEVFAADWPVTLVGLDVTQRISCESSDFQALGISSPRIGGFLEHASRFYFDFYRKRHALDVCFLHDPTAVIAVTNPEMFVTEKRALRVICDGERAGQVVTCTDGSRPDMDICLGVNADEVRALFLSVLANADAVSPMSGP